LNLPVLVINFKNYPEIGGPKALELSFVAHRVAKHTAAEIWLAPPTPALGALMGRSDLKILCQHVDPVRSGSSTGFLPADVAKEFGAMGSIVNHSEHRIPFRRVGQTVERLSELDMVSLVCAKTPEESGKMAALKPSLIAVEPPKLIGSGIAVSRAKPELVTKSISSVGKIDKDIPVLCGAGIVGGEDVRKALELGAKGVLVASGIIKSNNWEAKIREMAGELKTF
jgi:triosephosphate isomerase